MQHGDSIHMRLLSCCFFTERCWCTGTNLSEIKVKAACGCMFLPLSSLQTHTSDQLRPVNPIKIFQAETCEEQKSQAKFKEEKGIDSTNGVIQCQTADDAAVRERQIQSNVTMKARVWM